MQRAKAERLIFAGVALNEGVLFCVSHFGGLGLAADHVFKGDSLSRLASQAALKGSVCFAGGGSVEPIELEKVMRSAGLAGSDRPMQPKIDKPIKFYARASKIARREILNIGLRGPDDLKLRIFRNAADSCATRCASLIRRGLGY